MSALLGAHLHLPKTSTPPREPFLGRIPTRATGRQPLGKGNRPVLKRQRAVEMMRRRCIAVKLGIDFDARRAKIRRDARCVEIAGSTVIPFFVSLVLGQQDRAHKAFLGDSDHTASLRPYFPDAANRNFSSSLKKTIRKSTRPVFIPAESFFVYPSRVAFAIFPAGRP